MMFYGSFKKQYLQTGPPNTGVQPTRVPLRFTRAAEPPTVMRSNYRIRQDEQIEDSQAVHKSP